MQLGTLLAQAGCSYTNHDGDRLEVQRLVTDSRTCQPGDLFIGMPGSRVDGSTYAEQALAQGAIAAIISETSLVSFRDQSKIITVPDVVIACAEIAANFYDHPTDKLQLIGVTGTNGKTTTTHLIEFLLQSHYKTALLGTLYARWPGYSHTSTHTTPFAIDLQAQLKQSADAGCEAAVMEVSSHALAQKRVWGCKFAASVFTNLTQDHLDYHHNLEDYFQAKALLFDQDYLNGRAIINLDDTFGQRLANSISSEDAEVWTYSLANSHADFWVETLTYKPDGVSGKLHTPLGSTQFKSNLVGSFNVSNILAAIAAVLHLNLSLEEVVRTLSEFRSVPGRVEKVEVGIEQDITVVVDYAHTPDSLENVLKAMRPFTQNKLICVFGCGGDRDRTKRPIMGEIAARLSDRVFVTSDNPRTEEPQKILEDIMAGIPASINAVVEGDRRVCIQLAINAAQAGDTIVIAGKGHEDYQILGKEKIHFDDREEAQAALKLKYNLVEA